MTVEAGYYRYNVSLCAVASVYRYVLADHELSVRSGDSSPEKVEVGRVAASTRGGVQQD
jgi:hypothetical protein